METLGSATSCKTSWRDDVTVYAPRGGHVRAYPGEARIHGRQQKRMHIISSNEQRNV